MEVIHEQLDFKKLFSISEKFNLTPTGLINDIDFDKKPSIFFTGSADATISGFLAPSRTGQLLIIENNTNFNLTLSSNNTNSILVNRINLPSNNNIVLKFKEKLILIYTNNQWELLSLGAIINSAPDILVSFSPNTPILKNSQYIDETITSLLLTSRSTRTTAVDFITDINNNYITPLYKEVRTIFLIDGQSDILFSGSGVGTSERGNCKILVFKDVSGSFKQDPRMIVNVGFAHDMGGGVLYPYPTGVQLADLDIAGNLCYFQFGANFVVKNNLGYAVLLIVLYETRIAE